MIYYLKFKLYFFLKEEGCFLFYTFLCKDVGCIYCDATIYSSNILAPLLLSTLVSTKPVCIERGEKSKPVRKQI